MTRRRSFNETQKKIATGSQLFWGHQEVVGHVAGERNRAELHDLIKVTGVILLHFLCPNHIVLFPSMFFPGNTFLGISI